ncbi:MAG: hypothetical protein NTV04_20000 [Deltaproteobacteria bacterium]|nr:hypothetical protein [Deltaproteobacteria bacterium]
MSDLFSALAGVVVGGVVGGVSTYFCGIKIQEKLFRKAAGVRLWEAFKPEWTELNPVNIPGRLNTSILLKEAFPRHLAAVREFKMALPSKRWPDFDQSWQEYYGYQDHPNQPFLEQYMDQGVSSDKGKENRLLAFQRIGKILSFAEEEKKI